ncbi:lysophospholipid acyltransferase family protein [Dysgonomonas macrotermitis]|uniref:KDO2-lipid IV(A) lauroyltransferase n=1 Tax=Dysgonomonas macrotermitis TaxID=1346286 RepID=A0A1M5DS51_9BACT|nr:lysophospholipid acyltransferase family protein [Dysgonomonas macrotermitis]SHF69813.1 KDO2-lipid IV(A) lauroyltransferase [Dysgonomonas macrotermitis]
MTQVVYYIVYAILYIHALLPFRILYILSDILYVPVYYIIRYRLKVVRRNLKASFPEKNDKELKKIEQDFYHHLCDYFVETIKLLHVTNDEIQSRITFNNIDLVEKLMENGRSSIMFLGHYGNWEWVPSINLLFAEDTLLGQIYRPLKNKAFDDLFLKIRSRFGSVSIAKNNTLRAILEYKKENRKILIGFMSDQTPSYSNIHYWTEFLNQDTPVYTGVERIAKKTGFSVTYLDITKTGRGKYNCEVKLITAEPDKEPEFAITEKYIREMEKTILRQPAYWLWSHKRWKHKRDGAHHS